MFRVDGKFNRIYDKLIMVFVKRGIPVNSKMIYTVYNDIKELGFENAKRMVELHSPSKLGRLGFLGLRHLAIIKRDHPDKYQEIIRELEELLR